MPDKAARGEMGLSILPELVEGKELHLFLRVKAFRPFTLSPVLLVSLVQPFTSPCDQVSLPASAVLKLYDRRCLVNTRDNFDEGKPWSLDKELEYRRYLDDVATGAVAPGDFDSRTYLRTAVSDGEFEAYLQHTAQKLFNAELTTYERLRVLQGKKIPTLYGVVEYETQIAVSNACADGSAVTETIPGLLLEYVPSLTLRQLVATWTARDPPLPNGVLTTLCEEAVRVVDRVSDFDVLNKDVRMDNFLVREPFVASSSPSHGDGPAVVEDAVVLVDLAQCRLRREDESEDEWVEAKWSQDETGAVGFVALGLVCKFVGDGVWTYERSLRYYRPPEWLATAVLPPGFTSLLS